MKNKPVVIERAFKASVERIWQAITNKEDMEKWYFKLAEFKSEVGFEFQFYAGKDKKQWLHICKITEVVDREKLTYSWRYDGYPGISHVTFEIFPDLEESKTRLKLTHSGLENFPGHVVPELKKENFVEGWKAIIGKSLKDFLEKKKN